MSYIRIELRGLLIKCKKAFPSFLDCENSKTDAMNRRTKFTQKWIQQRQMTFAEVSFFRQEFHIDAPSITSIAM
jgi:hypothetical protein